ncbi:MAG: hypothetical protein H6855_04660 [Rhodospirillales bacterium]|nr:hypothetical protein [Rhodospirillales bacterium]MCB9973250.1 hypothetical protein [Rhodospirillales bacterium]
MDHTYFALQKRVMTVGSYHLRTLPSATNSDSYLDPRHILLDNLPWTHYKQRR